MTLWDELRDLVESREAELLAAVGESDATILERDSRIVELETEAVAQTERVGVLEAEVIGLKAHAEELNASLLAVTAERDAAVAALSAVSSERDAAVTALNRARTDLTAAQARIRQLEAQLDPAILTYWGAPVWRDEFEGSAIDPTKWKLLTGDLTVDSADLKTSAVTVANGKARIRGTWKPTPLPKPLKDNPNRVLTHDSGYLTHGHGFAQGHKQEYGRWEVRIKVPTGPNTKGTLPAFWLRNDQSGEEDVFEADGGGGSMPADWTTFSKDSARYTIHSDTNQKPEGVAGQLYVKSFWRYHEVGVSRDIPSRWITVAIEITPTYRALIVDGVERVRFTPQSPDPVNKVGSARNPSGTMAWAWNRSLFGSPRHVRINLHVGQYWGNPDPNNRQLTQDPLDYEIDYVRIWAMPA